VTHSPPLQQQSGAPPPAPHAAPPRLMPGKDVAAVLAGNPDLLLALQRGSRSLGPGAEF
jgi:hypothetical protein